MNLKSIGSVFYWIFVAALAGFTVLILTPLLPIPGNYRLLTVLSGSMEPAIKVGSLAIVAPAADYKVGDVVTFNAGGSAKSTVTHRINEIKTADGLSVYITKGDANNAPDNEPVAAANVIGKVRFDIPWLGYAIAAARQPIGFAVIVLVPVAWIIIDEIKKIIAEVKKSKQQSQKNE